MYLWDRHVRQPCRQEDTPQPHRKGPPQTVVLRRPQPLYQDPEYPLYVLGLATVLQPTQCRHQVAQRRQLTLRIPPLVQEHVAQPRTVGQQTARHGLDHILDGLWSRPAPAAIVE